MSGEIVKAIRFTVVTMLLFGVGYHATLWAVARVLFPLQAEGSLIRRPDGSLVGSRLIAQGFRQPYYFHSRPSAVGYDAAAAAGSNDGPSNPEYLDGARRRLATIMDEEGVPARQVPVEMITASGSGLDPHLPPSAVHVQAPRVAASRRVPVARVRALIDAATERPTFGVLGRTRVNVLELNLALDSVLGPPVGLPHGDPEAR